MKSEVTLSHMLFQYNLFTFQNNSLKITTIQEDYTTKSFYIHATIKKMDKNTR